MSCQAPSLLQQPFWLIPLPGWPMAACMPSPPDATQPATMHAAQIVLRCRFTFSVQDACGAQPLVTLFEGRSLRYGAAIVDVQTALITVASWQVRSWTGQLAPAALTSVDGIGLDQGPPTDALPLSTAVPLHGATSCC